MHITEAPRTFYFSGTSGILGPTAVLPRRRAHPFLSNPLVEMLLYVWGAHLGAPETRLGGKCAYYRSESLLLKEMCASQR